MANSPKLSNAAASAAADAVCVLANSGKLRIYDGTQPATADTAISTQVLLVELTFNSTAFAAANNGAATANAITSGTAVATSTATWFRAFKSDGTTVLFDGSVGSAGCDLNLSTTSIVTSATSGSENIAGTGAIAFGHPTLAGSGTELFTASGGVTFAQAVLAGTGTETIAGTGAVAFGGPTLSGNDIQPVTGSGDVAFAGPALAGAGDSRLIVNLPAGVNRHRVLIPIERIAPPAVSGTGGIATRAPALAGDGDASDDELALFLLLAA